MYLNQIIKICIWVQKNLRMLKVCDLFVRNFNLIYSVSDSTDSICTDSSDPIFNSNDDIFKAAFSLKDNISSGADGIPALFVENCLSAYVSTIVLSLQTIYE